MASVDELAARTPASRDRVVDLLRAASICAVVLGHWTVGFVIWDGGVIRTVNAVGMSSWLWLATWVFQVMPIFFFVGGFSNMVALDAFRRRGDSTAAFVRSRVERLVRPSLAFLGVWAVVQLALHLFDIGTPTGPSLWDDVALLRGMRPPGATVPFGPLWFLGVYLVVVAISPWTIALHRRFRWGVVAAMAIGAVAADAIGFATGAWAWRWCNVVFVLLLPHQLGHFYADGTLTRLPRRVFWWMVAGGLGGLLLLTNPPLWQLFGDVRHEWFPGIGAYPKSLLGTDVELVSNAYPPTVCFLLGGVWTIGAAMLLRPALARWLERSRPWKATIALNGVIMTLFLWHMTAFLLAVLTLWPLGLGGQTDTDLSWWLERPVWIAVSALYLVVLVAVFARFERRAAGGGVGEPRGGARLQRR